MKDSGNVFRGQMGLSLLPVKGAEASICDGVSVHQRIGDMHMCEGTIDTEVYNGKEWEEDICCQGNVFSQEVSRYFGRTLPCLILYVVQQTFF